ncbi:hypothetical protein AAFF_G00288840 [Aldrovandia affinis]|uniref:Uncharacterized protein n=1 Tax=Aldrovandia affinis TaxID=143900 RepID=A0AAD7SS46_9TELE|nr:hypothetical protein AAFF_G00288840 [Aldrovandia affinis]
MAQWLGRDCVFPLQIQRRFRIAAGGVQSLDVESQTPCSIRWAAAHRASVKTSAAHSVSAAKSSEAGRRKPTEDKPAFALCRAPKRHRDVHKFCGSLGY